MAKYRDDEDNVIELSLDDLNRIKKERKEKEQKRKELIKQKKLEREKKKSAKTISLSSPNLDLNPLKTFATTPDELEELKQTFLQKREQYEKFKEIQQSNKPKDFFDKYNETIDNSLPDFFSDEDFMLEEEKIKNNKENTLEENNIEQPLDTFDLLKNCYDDFLIDTSKNQNKSLSFYSKFSSKVPPLPLISPDKEISLVSSPLYVTFDKDTGIPFQPPDVKYDSPISYTRYLNSNLKKRKPHKITKSNFVMDKITPEDGIPEDIAEKINNIIDNYVTREEYLYEINKVIADIISAPSLNNLYDVITDPFWGSIAKYPAFKSASQKDRYFSKWIKDVEYSIYTKILTSLKYNKNNTKMDLDYSKYTGYDDFINSRNDQKEQALILRQKGFNSKKLKKSSKYNSKNFFLPQVVVSPPFSQIFSITSICKCIDDELPFAEKYGYSIICCVDRQFFRCALKYNSYDLFWKDNLPADVQKNSNIFILEESTLLPFFLAFFSKHISYEDSVDYAVVNLLQYIDKHYNL